MYGNGACDEWDATIKSLASSQTDWKRVDRKGVRVDPGENTHFRCCVTIVWNETCAPVDKAYHHSDHIVMSLPERVLVTGVGKCNPGEVGRYQSLEKHASQSPHASKYT
jgi:hypothetical protein